MKDSFSRGIDAAIARAIVKQIRFAVLRMRLPKNIGDHVDTRPIRGVLQGHSGSPCFFNMVMADCLEAYNLSHLPAKPVGGGSCFREHHD